MWLLEILLYIIIGIALIVGIPIGILLLKHHKQSRPRRKPEPGFELIYIEDDGSARELTAKEIEHLSKKYEFGDSGRPYIKSHYESETPIGLIGGYLRRRQLPPEISIKSSSD